MNVNGYRIRYNSVWDTYQVVHWVNGLVAQFETKQEAIEYCYSGVHND